jgi:hypothetical protein
MKRQDRTSMTNNTIVPMVVGPTPHKEYKLRHNFHFTLSHEPASPPHSFWFSFIQLKKSSF